MDTKIFDTLLEPVFVLNEKKEILYCNEVASSLCDSSPRKLIRNQCQLDQIFQFAVPLESLNNLTQISDATPYQEVAFKTNNNKTGKIQVTFQPFYDLDQQKTWIAFFRDVTLEETLQRKYRAELEQKENVILDLKDAQAQLEKYSKTLEKMVEDRTAQIQSLNQMMSALLDSLGQGFFIFDKNGICLEIFSKACKSTVECKPPGKKIWDVLKLDSKHTPGFKKWMTTAFAEMLPFEDLAPLAPQSLLHTEGKQIQLEYHPLRQIDPLDQKNEITGIVVVATDVTKLVQAQKEAETERAHAKMILSLIFHKRHLVSFIQESQALLGELKYELSRESSADSDNLFRILHTLKGGAASFSIKPLVDQTHLCESLLLNWKSDLSAKSFQELKVSALKVESYFQQFLSDNQAILGSAARQTDRWVEIPTKRLCQFQSKLPKALQNEFMTDFLMEPIGEHFRHYDEIIKSLAEREMKSVAPLIFSHPQIPILPEIYSQLFSTLIHQFRNSVDHGIESEERRREKGKKPQGQIEVSFSLREEKHSQWLWIEIKDDGGGIDPQKIRARLTSKGLNTDNETDQQVIQHIFDSQFSTKDVITEVSGRGVGMDAILHASKKLGGTAWVESKVDEYTCLFVKVPYLTNLPKTSPSPRDGNQAA